jgi:hypothetical protein
MSRENSDRVERYEVWRFSGPLGRYVSFWSGNRMELPLGDWDAFNPDGAPHRLLHLVELRDGERIVEAGSGSDQSGGNVATSSPDPATVPSAALPSPGPAQVDDRADLKALIAEAQALVVDVRRSLSSTAAPLAGPDDGKAEDQRAELARQFYALVANDAWAISFQTMGQYRLALLGEVRRLASATPAALPVHPEEGR